MGERGESVLYPAEGGRVLGIPFDLLATRRDGDVLTDRWWCVRDGRALFWQRKGGRGWTPQCNSDRRMPDRLALTIHAPADVEFLPVAYLGHSDEEWGHRLAWATASDRTASGDAGASSATSEQVGQ